MKSKRKSSVDLDIAAAVKLILEDYRWFLGIAPNTADDGATKAFAARHAAGRAALTHLEHVLKLGSEHGEQPAAQAASECLSEWRARMPPQAEEEPEIDGDGAGG